MAFRTAFSSASVGALLVALLPSLGQAQAPGQIEVIRSSAILTRTGDREPYALADLRTIQLSSVGTNQAWQAGDAFRRRYMPTSQNNTATPVAAELYGLGTDALDINQLFILSGDEAYNMQTAQAFMQGLYPPYQVPNVPAVPFDRFIVANGSTPVIQQNAVNGYQYPLINTAGNSDGTSVIIDGAAECENWYTFNEDFPGSAQYNAAEQQSKSLYSAVGKAVGNEIVPAEEYSFASAPLVYDYVSYEFNHNVTFREEVQALEQQNLDPLPRLQYLADQYNFALYSNAVNDENSYNSPIATVAGQTFAGGVMQMLQANIDNGGSTPKLSLFFSEYQPFLSFFTLAGLVRESNLFWGMPLPGSNMVFELLSYADPNNQTDLDTYPSADDLHVRFMFRNGSDGDLDIWPLFNLNLTQNGTISWNDFNDRMSQIMITTYDVWCAVCDSWLTSPWCLYYNNTVVDDIMNGDFGNGGSPGPYTITPKAAGVIGAVATLATIGVLLILGIAIGGLRFKRASPKPKSSLGGFKGNQKLASDADLTHDRKSTAGASIVEEPKGHERVGSWELKDGQGVQRPQSLRRASIEEDDRFNPFNDPVRPRESV